MLSSELYMLAVMSIMASDKPSLFLCLATSLKVRKGSCRLTCVCLTSKSPFFTPRPLVLPLYCYLTSCFTSFSCNRLCSFGRKPSIPSITIEWLLVLQQLQLTFMQSLAKLWLHILQLQMLSKGTALVIFSNSVVRNLKI
jgi:hypothetical protein